MDIHIKIEAPPPATSVNTTRVASIYDLDITKPRILEWNHHLSIEDQPWQIGLIYGNSGSGKTTLAKRIFPGKQPRESYEWDERPIVDGF